MGQSFRLPPLLTGLDLLLIAAVAAASLFLYGARWFPNRQNHQLWAVIQYENRILARVPLDRDTTFSVTGALGPALIRIERGGLSFVQSPCPQHLCEKSGSIGSAGSIVVCAPNRLLAKIVDDGLSGEEKKTLDSITR